MIGDTGRIWRIASKTGYNVQFASIVIDDVCYFWYTEGYLELEGMDSDVELTWRVV